MASREDVSVRWDLSPRIITVAAPSTSINIQDLHDTLRDLEDEPANLIYPTIIFTAGKEPLGGGVTVGLTATLQNARLQFQGRPDFYLEGGATLGSNGNTLIDGYATFISDGVQIGDIIENDQKTGHAEVIVIISETELMLTSMPDGKIWDAGDDYEIWHTIQCVVDGGNLVAADEAGDAIDSIFPSAFTQVIRTSSSSATLQELEAIQFSSFNGQIHINADTGTSSTTYPAGTGQQPVNNIADALTIAAERGFKRLFFESSFTFEAGDNVSLFEIEGASETRTVLTFNSGTLCAGSEFAECTLTGTLVSPAAFRHCIIGDIVGGTIGIAGTIDVSDCLFTGTITLSPALEGQLDIVNCESGVAGLATPVFDGNGANADVIFRNYSGGMEIRGLSNVAANNISIDMNSGNIILDSSCTTGTIILRGISTLTDNTAGATVITSGLIFPESLQLSAFREEVFLDVNNGSTGTKFPKGTQEDPVNNLTDAKTIAASRSIANIKFIGTLVIQGTDVIDNLIFDGQNAGTSIIVLLAGCSTVGTQFNDVTVTGVVDGNIIIRRSGVLNLTNLGSDILGTTIATSSLLDSVSPCLGFKTGLTTPQNLQLLECNSLTSTGDGAVIDLNDSATPVIFTVSNGPYLFKNWTAGQNGKFNLGSGEITFDATCTSGVVKFDGIGKAVNLDVGFTIDDTNLVSPEKVSDMVHDEQTSEHTIAGSTGAQADKIAANAALIPGTL